MIDTASVISIDLQLCGQCGGCVAACRFDAIYLSPIELEINHNACTLCGDCLTFCPIGALSFDQR